MIESFFPLGAYNYIIGGLLIGFGISFIFLVTGIVSGASTFFSSTLSYFSRFDYFHQKKFLETRGWRNYFAVGIILGAFLYSYFTNNFFITEVSIFSLILGGLLIGFGTRLSSGCTAGHGICGLSKFSMNSLFAVLTFLITAIVTANLIKYFLVANG